jgi:hypothetical protein
VVDVLEVRLQFRLFELKLARNASSMPVPRALAGDTYITGYHGSHGGALTETKNTLRIFLSDRAVKCRVTILTSKGPCSSRKVRM